MPLPRASVHCCSHLAASRARRYWTSHHTHGDCIGALAHNFTASPFSFPDGLRALGLGMQLFYQV